MVMLALSTQLVAWAGVYLDLHLLAPKFLLGKLQLMKLHGRWLEYLIPIFPATARGSLVHLCSQ